MSPRARAALAAAALAAAVALVYAPALDHAFLSYDDDLYITENPFLELGLSREGLAWAAQSTRGSNWFPVTRLSFLADFELHGLSSAGVHGVNLALHALNAVLLMLALRALTGALAPSALVAAVFALHPLNVESVAWATERKGLLCATFWMLTLRAYAARPSALRGVGVGAGFALALMSKPVAITLPAVLLLVDFWPGGGGGRIGPSAGGSLVDPRRAAAALAAKLPLLLLAGGSAAITLHAQQQVTVPLEALPVGERLANAAVAYTDYLRSFVWPTGLAVFYPHPEEGLGVGRTGLAAAVLLAVSGLALARARRQPYLLVGWLWFLGVLVPMLGLVQVGSQARADRYAYLPTIGLAIAVVWLGADASERLGVRARRALLAAALAAVVGLAGLARVQLGVWSDTQHLFEHALAVTRPNVIAHSQLGLASARAGRPRQAVAHYRAARERGPGYPPVANHLAWLLATAADPDVRRPEEALAIAREAARQAGGRDPALLDTLAAAHAANGNFDRARRFARAALERAERAGDARLAAGVRERLALYEQGRPYRESGESGGSGESSESGVR